MTLRKLIVVIVLLGAVVAVVLHPDVRLKVTSLLQSEGDKKESPVSLRNPLSVCVTRTGTHYHRPDCTELKGKNKVLRPLATARQLHKPCPKCNPPK